MYIDEATNNKISLIFQEQNVSVPEPVAPSQGTKLGKFNRI